MLALRQYIVKMLAKFLVFLTKTKPIITMPYILYDGAKRELPE